MNHKTLVALLKRRQGRRTQTALAQELGIKKSYLSQILRGRVDAGPLVLRALGLERVVTYREKQPRQKKRLIETQSSPEATPMS